MPLVMGREAINMQKRTYIKDLLTAWLTILTVQVAMELLLPREWERKLPQLVGLIQFYPYLFFVILTLLRVRIVIRSEKKKQPCKRGLTKRQFWIAVLVLTVLLPSLIIWGFNAYYHYNLMPISRLWVLQIVVYVLLFNIIIFKFEIVTMFIYHLPGFIFSFLFALLGSIYFSHALTLLLTRTVMLALMILGLLIVGCITLPFVLAASPHLIIIEKAKRHKK